MFCVVVGVNDNSTHRRKDGESTDTSCAQSKMFASVHSNNGDMAMMTTALMIMMIRTSTVTNHIDADNTVKDFRNLMLWTLLTKARTALELCKLECRRVL